MPPYHAARWNNEIIFRVYRVEKMALQRLTDLHGSGLVEFDEQWSPCGDLDRRMLRKQPWRNQKQQQESEAGQECASVTRGHREMSLLISAGMRR